MDGKTDTRLIPKDISLPCSLNTHTTLTSALALDFRVFDLICGHSGAVINVRETP